MVEKYFSGTTAKGRLQQFGAGIASVVQLMLLLRCGHSGCCGYGGCCRYRNRHRWLRRGCGYVGCHGGGYGGHGGDSGSEYVSLDGVNGKGGQQGKGMRS